MGDRCFMRITCRREDREVFERIGFHLDFDQPPDSPLLEMVDEEANCAHCDLMPTNVPYEGYHSEGGCYGVGVFACDGQQYGEVEAGHDGGYVIAWDEKENRPTAESVNAIHRYLGVLSNVKALFEEVAKASTDYNTSHPSP